MSTTVLIIDGDPTFAEPAQEALQAGGMTVLVRFDASLDDVRQIRPRVLILSAELPRGSGFGLCSRVRRDPDLRDVAILLVTAEVNQQALMRHARSAEPANDYARKDIPMGDLVHRVGRLLAQAPTLMVSDVPEDDDPKTERFSIGPPPLPRTDSSTPSSEVRPAGPMSSTSRPMTGPMSGTVQLLEMWPREALDLEFRQALATNDVESPSKARTTPEERLVHLRQLVKQHETREKAVRQLWDHALSRGQDLARRLVTTNASLVEARDSQTHAEALQRDAEQQRDTVQDEFRTFEEEIRRIFSEKDAEEKAQAAEVEALQAKVKALEEGAAEAQEQRQVDAQRLSFLQEELDALNADKEAVVVRSTSLERLLSSTERQVKDLTARLETAEHVARERAESLAAAQDQLDELTFDIEQRGAAVARAYNDDLATQAAKHAQEVADLTAAYEGQLATLAQQHEEQVETLRREAEAAIKDKDLQHQAGVAALETHHVDEIRDLTAAHEGVLARVHAARDDAQTESDRLRALLERSHEALQDAAEQHETSRTALETQLARAEGDLAELRLEASEAQRALHTLASSTDDRIEALERTVDDLQTRLLDTEADLQQEKSAHEALEVEHARTLTELEEALQVEAKPSAEEIQAAENRVRTEAEKALRVAARRLADLEDEVDGLHRSIEAERARTAEAIGAQHDLEEQVTQLGRERSDLLVAVAESKEQADLQIKLDLSQQQISAQEDFLNESRFATESIRNALEALTRDLAQERKKSASPAIQALLDRVERVTSMSLDALATLAGEELDTGTVRLPQVDGHPPAGDNVPAPPFAGTYRDLPVLPGGDPTPSLAGVSDDDTFSGELTDAQHAAFGAAGLPVETEEEAHITEVIDLKGK